jgi:hypothetical protein
MSSNLIGLVISAVGCIIAITVAVGLPALAVIAIRFFKYKERELALEMEYRQKAQQQQEQQQQQQLAIEQRVQCLEDALTSLDHDVRVQLGIGQQATPLPSRPDLLEGPAAPEAQREKSLDPSRTRAR